MRAASSLGASGFYAFCRVYFHEPARRAVGALIVYILSIRFRLSPRR